MAKPQGLIAMLTSSGGGGALERAVEDLFEAYKKNDAKAGAAALRRAVELCEKPAEEDEPEADEDEPATDDGEDEDELLDL
jgi:hypothetical protein